MNYNRRKQPFRGLQQSSLLKKQNPTQNFSLEFSEIIQNNFFGELCVLELFTTKIYYRHIIVMKLCKYSKYPFSRRINYPWMQGLNQISSKTFGRHQGRHLKVLYTHSLDPVPTAINGEISTSEKKRKQYAKIPNVTLY